AARVHPTMKSGPSQSLSQCLSPETAKTCQNGQKRANQARQFRPSALSVVNTDPLMSSTAHVEFSLRAGTGEIRLNRPEELNALTLEMIEAIDGQLAAWAKDPKVTGILIGKTTTGDAFCAGVDQRALYNALQSGDRDYGAVVYRRFYQLLYRLATYPKTTIAVMDGITMGGGVALGAHCKIRVGTRNAYLAFADCKIGYFPDG